MTVETSAALRPVRQSGDARAAIVFIHGFGGDITKTWGQFPQFLASERRLQGWDIWVLGYSSHLAIDVLGIWAADPDLDKLGQRLATDVLKGTLSRYVSVALIAHSMGGLITQRALVNEPDLALRTSHVLLYGTPSGGLKKATLGWLLKPQLRNMSAGGEFITSLRQDWQARFAAPGILPFVLMVAAGERDEFVPAESALGPFRAAPFTECTAVVPGNHTGMVKPDTADAACVQVAVNALTGSTKAQGASAAASLAVELSQFQQAIDRWLPRAAELDRQAQVQLSIALDRVGRREEAIALLRGPGGAGSDTDAMGTLAGRLKRRWLVDRIDADGREALALYRRGLQLARQAGDLTQIPYHGVNVAFLQFAMDGDLAGARSGADGVLRDCDAAESAGNESADQKLWRRATEAEALLLLGRQDEARSRYQRVLQDFKPQPWQLDSMHLQAVHLANLLGGEALQAEVSGWFAV